MKKFIKSSSRVKPDRAYYEKKADYFRRKRDALMDAAGLNDDVQPPDSPELRAKCVDIDRLAAKVIYYSRMIPVATRMQDAIREGRPIT